VYGIKEPAGWQGSCGRYRLLYGNPFPGTSVPLWHEAEFEGRSNGWPLVTGFAVGAGGLVGARQDLF